MRKAASSAQGVISRKTELFIAQLLLYNIQISSVVCSAPYP
jgi:hypothetical protein